MLQQKLQQKPNFKDWKHLEILTAACANEIIQNTPNYAQWSIHYNQKAQTFPDIVIETPDKKFGIEVKSSRSKNWQTLGGSIHESTKAQELDEIFIVFGKNIDQHIQVRVKPFAQCVNNIAVTHSPRYLIDMNLEDGTDLFSQLNTSYAAVRASDRPFDIFKQYFKDKAKKANTKFWYLSDNEDERTSETFQHLELRFFKQLPVDEQQQLICEAIILYPEDLFGFTHSKYENANLFFLSRNVISNSMRDNFSAGGKIEYFGEKFPQKIQLLLDENNLKIIQGLLSSEPTLEMKDAYGLEDITQIRACWNTRISEALQQTICKNKSPMLVQKLLQHIVIE